MSFTTSWPRLALSLGLLLCTTAVARADDPASDGSYLYRSETCPATLQGVTTNLEVILPTAASFARPVVIICHGWMAPTLLYEGMAHHLASRGFAAVLFEQPNFYSADMQSWANNTHDAISELDRLTNDPKSAIYGELDMSRVGVMGHSRGGACITTLAGQDARVKCAVALAPADWWDQAMLTTVTNAAATITAPYMVIIGNSDTWLASPAVAESFYHVAKHSAERELIEPTGGGHMMYFGGGSDDVLSSRYYTSWLERFLMNKSDAYGYTTGAEAAAELKSGVLAVAEHATASGAPAPSSGGVLKQGSTGPDVSAVQQKLKDLGLYSGAVDGDFGPATEKAVIAFQQSQGLTADGIVGPATKKALGL